MSNPAQHRESESCTLTKAATQENSQVEKINQVRNFTGGADIRRGE
jgi:hypothetical protein